MCFYSHAIKNSNGDIIKKTSLKTHLLDVGASMKKISQSVLQNSIKQLSGLAYLIGRCHDFGKYTAFFQDYLLYNAQDGTGTHHHGLLSALFASYCAETYLHGCDFRYAPLFAYFTVLHHHGDLRALELDVIPPRHLNEENFLSVNDSWRSRLICLEKQIKDITCRQTQIEKEFSDDDTGLFKGVDLAAFCTDWKSIFENLYKTQYFLLHKEADSERRVFFILLLFLYSALIDSDKMTAARIERNNRNYIPDDIVEKYRQASPKINTDTTTGMNGIRNEIYRLSVENISKVNLDNRIITLTAPTGTGKTLTALATALKLRDRVSTGNYPPRIIYALPFTSIIDQNFNEIRNVLTLLNDFKENEGLYLIKHHHLADLRYRKDNEEKSVNEALMYMESWESEVIVTTFVQLLHTIIGFKNRFLKKFHNIAGSIIILDEVQNIPIEYWPLVGNMLRLLCECCGCYIILCTATAPLIFDKKDTVSVIENPEKYFNALDRVELIPDSTEISVEDLSKKFAILFDPSKSYLVVLNTIKTSVAFYENLKNNDIFKEHFCNGRVFYLSTAIVPNEREDRINRIKKLLDNKQKVVVVSTQLVEAGVDIDLDVVIRDIGPVDSIIQVAGRCNRGMTKEKGIVYIFNLTDRNNAYAKYVYGAKHYEVALRTLNKPKYTENNFYHLINSYFEEVKNTINLDDSNDIWEAVNQFRFHMPQEMPKSISDFHLITDNFGYVDVFVETCWCAQHIWLDYVKNVLEEPEMDKRREYYLKIRSNFKRFIISAPEKLTAGLEQIGELKKIPRVMLDQYYEKDTGFKRTGSESSFF